MVEIMGTCKMVDNTIFALVLVLRQARLSLKQPSISASEYLESLRRQGLSRTCTPLEPFLPEL